MFDILPQGLGDDRPGLGVNPEQTRQSRVQLELGRLVVQQQQDRTPHVLVARTLHLWNGRRRRQRGWGQEWELIRAGYVGLDVVCTAELSLQTGKFIS